MKASQESKEDFEQEQVLKLRRIRCTAYETRLHVMAASNIWYMNTLNSSSHAWYAAPRCGVEGTPTVVLPRRLVAYANGTDQLVI